MEKNLHEMGIVTVGDLAHTELKQLEKRFGVMGNQLYYHAWGIDYSTLGEPLVKGQISYSKGQMLMRDYNTRRDICVVLPEMCEEVAKRARTAGHAGRTISLGLSYSHAAMTKGFYRSKTIQEPTNDTLAIYEVCKELLQQHFLGEPARQLSVRLSNIEKTQGIQLDLFDPAKSARQALAQTMDAIRNKFGATSLLRAVSYTSAGTAIQRDRLVGGHLA